MSSTLQSFPLVSLSKDDVAFEVLSTPRQNSQNSNPPHPPSPSKEQHKGKSKTRPGSYEALGLNTQLCAALQNAGYSFPTPIQRKCIPHILGGADVVAMARTGSGKTAAFLAPLLQNLAVPVPAASSRRNGPRALIISPTRELALQTLKFTRQYTRNSPIRTAVVLGGAPLVAQFESLAVCPPLVIATPGRLLQLLAEMGARNALSIATTEMLVLDEADRLFEGTLAVETAAFLAHLRDATTETLANRQTILVSATMPHALAEFSRTRLRPNLRVIRLDVDKTLPPTLACAFLLSRADVEKDAALQCLLRRLSTEKKSTVIFAATHRRVEYLTALLRAVLGIRVVCVHGNLDQVARIDAVSKFRKNLADVLVVTDVAARGIDLPLLDVVVNYDVPPTPKLFVHRVGRVARAGKFGIAFNIVAPDEISFMLDIFLFLGRDFKALTTNVGDPHDPFSSQAYAIESSFLHGTLPKAQLDEEVEIARDALQKVDLKKLHSSAKNAHTLYTKTRGAASGESVKRAKMLLTTEDGGRHIADVHPWFAAMESSIEREASHQASLLSAWRPRECIVNAPNALKKRKRRTLFPENLAEWEEEDENGHDGKVHGKQELLSVQESAAKLKVYVSTNKKRQKTSARQLALEEERKQFFLPVRQDAGSKFAEEAMRVKTGGKMADNLSAYRELNDAAVDLNADDNADLLRSKNTGANSAKYWDRVSKKFVKGGVTKGTSKRNLHVASKEAKARARSGESYGTEDGTLFKKWLSQNKKKVEQMAGQLDAADQGAGPSHLGLQNGLGSNDFRKGAFGRRARIAAAARNKEQVATNKTSGKHGRTELKSVEEIRKVRKEKSKAEAKRQARLNNNPGRSKAKKQQHYPQSQRGSSKSKLIIRKR